MIRCVEHAQHVLICNLHGLRGAVVAVCLAMIILTYFLTYFIAFFK